MAKHSECIYGADPKGEAPEIQRMGMAKMGALSVTDKAAKSDGPDTSDSSDTRSGGSTKP